MRLLFKSQAPRSRHAGFSMIEILISLIVIAIAMLGAAGIQLNVLRLNKGSQSRTQAIFLAADMAERMEANKAGAVAGNYSQVLTAASSVAATDCTAAPCAPPDLAAWDVSAWGQEISLLLPQASWSITTAAVGSPTTYTILIKWVDRSDVDSVATGNIVNSYSTQRTIY